MEKLQRILGTKDAAKYLNASPQSLYQLVYKKQIPCRKRGNRLVFLKEELDAYIDSLTVNVSLKEVQQWQQGEENNENITKCT